MPATVTGPQKWKKVLWAVDVLAEDKDLQKKTIEVASSIAKKTGAVIEPVFVMGPKEFSLGLQLFEESEDALRKQLEFKLAHWVSEAKVPGCAVPKVLSSKSLQIRDAVIALADYARSCGADVILASTMARKGASRFVFGSFAETLVLRSDLPVLMVSPKCDFSGEITEVLFPSDLSANFQFALPYVASMARQWGSKVRVFHHLEKYNPHFPESAILVPGYGDFLKTQEAEKRAVLARAVEALADHGVSAQTILDNHSSFTVDAILKEADSLKSGAIALVSESSALAAGLLGSISRRVMRETHSLVWVIHHKPTI